MKINIREPDRYFSYLDEKHFFDWLESIPAVRGVNPVSGGELEIALAEEVDEPSLRDLIALMRRYELDMRCLQALCTNENEKWMKNRSAYWYKYIFGDTE